LRRGRHNLSREAVLASQRERIVAATWDCVASKGYAATTVTDIVSAARVSRNAFYALFVDKEDCFLACCDAETTAWLSELAEQANQPNWRVALDQGMAAYLTRWRDNPEFAKAYLLEMPAAGARALAQRERSYAAYRRMLEALARRARVEEPDRPSLTPLAARLVVVGITEIVTEQVRAGAIDTLMSLHGDLVDFAEHMLVEWSPRKPAAQRRTTRRASRP
jgi:AcrR family transcriptional regulator